MKRFDRLKCILVIISLAIGGCSGSNTTPSLSEATAPSAESAKSVGSVTAKLVWNGITSAAKTVASAPTGVATVRLAISGNGISPVMRDFQASAGTGTLDSIAVGNGYTLDAYGIDSNGIIIFSGQAQNINVIQNQVTNVGTVVLSAIDVTSGLVGNYTFNDGTAKDVSGSGNDGVFVGNVTADTGIEGGALKFNDSMVKVTNSSSLQFSNAMSISYWIRMDADTGTEQTVIAKDGDNPGFAVMNMISNNKFVCEFKYTQSNVWFSNSNDVQNYSVGQWMHVVYVLTNTDFKLYVNNVPTILTMTYNGTLDFSMMNSKDLYMGKFGDGYWYPLNGALDDVRIYNRTLSPLEVERLYASGLNHISP